jgi:hypothetical protein
MVPAERLHKGHDLAGTEELLSSDEAVAASLYQGGGLAADIAEPVAVAPDRHDCDRASVGQVPVDPQDGPVGPVAAAALVHHDSEPVAEQPAHPPLVEPADEVADAGDKPGHHCAAVILALLRMRAPPR